MADDAPTADEKPTASPDGAATAVADAATLDADEIEALLAAAAAGSVELPPEEDEGTDPEDADGDRADDDRREPAAEPRAAGPTHIPVGSQVEKLLEEVEADVRRGRRSVLAKGDRSPGDFGDPSPLELEALAEAAGGEGPGGSLGSLDAVELDLRIELGRTEMSLEEVVGLRDGSVVALDKLAGDPVDILVNGRLVARGEVLVLNENFCVRVAEILAPDP